MCQQSLPLQEQSYGNDTDVVSFPLQHVGKVTVIFLWIPLQRLPLFFSLQSATLYILLQIVIGMILAIHVFLVEAGVYPGELAVILGIVI